MIIGISGKIGSGKDTIGNIIRTLTATKPDGFHLESDWKIKKFAYKLKQIVSLLTGISVEDLEKQEIKDSLLGEEWIRYGYADGFFQSSKGTIMNNISCSKERYEQELKTNWQTAYKHQYTVRDLLQLIGTEAMRNVIHLNIWVNALFVDYISKYKNEPLEPLGRLDDNNVLIPQDNFPNWIITDVRFPNELKAIKDRKGITIRVNRPINLRFPKIWSLYISDNKVEHSIGNFISWLLGANEDMRELHSKINHPSETALDNANFDYVINNNGTIEELVEKVRDILVKEKIIC